MNLIRTQNITHLIHNPIYTYVHVEKDMTGFGRSTMFGWCFVSWSLGPVSVPSFLALAIAAKMFKREFPLACLLLGRILLICYLLRYTCDATRAIQAVFGLQSPNIYSTHCLDCQMCNLLLTKIRSLLIVLPFFCITTKLHEPIHVSQSHPVPGVQFGKS